MMLPFNKSLPCRAALRLCLPSGDPVGPLLPSWATACSDEDCPIEQSWGLAVLCGIENMELRLDTDP